MKTWLFVPAVVALAVFLGGLLAAADDAPPKFKVTLKRPDDSHEVTGNGNKTVLEFKSPKGISQATVERQDEQWPKVVVLHLRLTGLEKVQIDNGKVTLNGAVSSATKVRLWKDNDETKELTKTDPLWMEIRPIGNDGKPAAGIPLKDGYFEMTLPKALLDDNPKALTVQWIDFYR